MAHPEEVVTVTATMIVVEAIHLVVTTTAVVLAMMTTTDVATEVVGATEMTVIAAAALIDMRADVKKDTVAAVTDVATMTAMTTVATALPHVTILLVSTPLAVVVVVVVTMLARTAMPAGKRTKLALLRCFSLHQTVGCRFLWTMLSIPSNVLGLCSILAAATKASLVFSRQKG